MRRIAQFFDSWSSRAANAAAIWPLLPASVVGVVTGFGSQSIEWISQFGWFGWWCAFLVGFFFSAAGLAVVGYAREKFALAKAQQRWSKEVDAINPLDEVFVNRRINIRDLAHPVTKRISSKTFRSCELFGPENIILASGHMSGVAFADCDVVVVKDNASLTNLKVFEDCSMTGGVIWNCTIFVTQAAFEAFRQGVGEKINVITDTRL